MKKFLLGSFVLGLLVLFAGIFSRPASATFTHVDECNEEFEYTTTNDENNSRVEIDFFNTGSPGNPDSIKIEAKSGYSLVEVKLDVENDDHGGYFNYTGNFPGTFNPNPGEDIDGAYVKVKKVCPTGTPTSSPTPTASPTPSEKDQCENLNGMQATVPANMQTDEEHQCTCLPGYHEVTIEENGEKLTRLVADFTCEADVVTTPPPNQGGPGDGLSDGRSDGRSSCPECTAPPSGQVLGASTDFAQAGVAEDIAMNVVGILGGLSTAAGLALKAFKRS